MKPVRILIFILFYMLTIAIFCNQARVEPHFKIMTGKTSELLQTSLKNGEAILWHFYHSGFAVKTARHLLIFDYLPGRNVLKDKKGLAAGLIDPDEIKEENVIVFISHEHSDHWYRGCLRWQDKVKRIHYVVSPEVSREDKRFASREGLITTLAANMVAKVRDVSIKTLLSTDSGVAFLVKTDGLTIYHSGDHACWNWDNNPKLEKKFVRERLKPLEGENIDIAMHVCESRLKASGWGGIFAFARKYKPKLLVPMHLFGNYNVTPEIESLLKEYKIPVSFWPIQSCGDCIMFQPRR
ncbi:MAG: hypothetical protein GTO45_06975 [Candidatus Aminicenantes bacterium]|nr:hypothetical protein [Candidatus Aminicenantes bacterium]NIM78583.1 hypothetical protein [Candidatus Aminicenantes bacterium]NIN17829.1 hypothetical protein [Candidatus Aminicenantes bacterium]NIN41733.1 hypothetical protein [Candidatus Aminicenantes bacterium]NIN84482.1 hypothetical protein [Candidatus Aminicenantes bacterium]